MILQTEKQLRALQKIPANQRMLEVDATGCLVKIEKYMRPFKQILNYVMLAKDIGNLKNLGINVTEMSTSRHDTFGISEMFNLFIYNYKTIFPTEARIFKLLICDFSWATIHAALLSFNREYILEYAARVFQLSKGLVSHDDPSRLWLVSCCAHTMHRLCLAIKRRLVFKEKEYRHFAINCFSLLLNCLSLPTCSEVFRLICIVHIYPVINFKLLSPLIQLILYY